MILPGEALTFLSFILIVCAFFFFTSDINGNICFSIRDIMKGRCAHYYQVFCMCSSQFGCSHTLMGPTATQRASISGFLKDLSTVRLKLYWVYYCDTDELQYVGHEGTAGMCSAHRY